MKRLLFSLLFFSFAPNLSAQDLVTQNGSVSFLGERPFEKIRADSHEVSGVLHQKTGDVEFRALIKSFHFRKKSMEKSFNQKYMESDRYPETSFIGKVVNFAHIDLSKPGTYQIMVDGDLSIHNVTRRVSHPAVLTVTQHELIARSQFAVKPSDFKISVPRLFGRALISEINVAVDMRFPL